MREVEKEKNVFLSFPREKLVVILGLFIASVIGAWFLASLGSALALTQSGFLGAFLVKNTAYLLGMFVGAGLYLQLLKDFKIWPMEKNGLPSFRPSVFVQDILQALKTFDWEILEYLNRIATAKLQREGIEREREEERTEEPPLFSWLGKKWGGLNDWVAQKTKEKAGPYVVRAVACQLIHNLSFHLSNRNYLDTLSADERQELFANDLLSYQAGTFMLSIHRSDAGFVETASRAIYHEYQNPPRVSNR